MRNSFAGGGGAAFAPTVRGNQRFDAFDVIDNTF